MHVTDSHHLNAPLQPGPQRGARSHQAAARNVARQTHLDHGARARDRRLHPRYRGHHRVAEHAGTADRGARVCGQDFLELRGIVAGVDL